MYVFVVVVVVVVVEDEWKKRAEQNALKRKLGKIFF